MSPRKPDRRGRLVECVGPVRLAAVVLATMLALAYLWEYYVEAPTMLWLGLPYDVVFEHGHRWRFILTATGFTALSLIVPCVLLSRAMRMTGEARQRAEEANEAKTRFLANMNHELRTPLNAIIGFAELIRDRAGDGDGGRFREYAADIHNSGRQLLALIDDVLDFARAEEGTLELKTNDFDLAETLRDMERMLASLVESRQLAYRTEIEPGLPLVRADEARLRQALFNLLSNCIKFTPPEGKVSVAARRNGGAVSLTIDDTGIGIPAEVLPKVFAPFSQADTSLARRFGGAGLGVPIAKRLVERMGGAFDLQSTVGKGTRVTIELPASDGADRPTIR